MIDFNSSNVNVYGYQQNALSVNSKTTKPIGNSLSAANSNSNLTLKPLENDTFDYSKDDGIISTEDKLKNIGKGLIKPVTDMFSSPENFVKGAAMIGVGVALTVATGGAALPFLAAAGVTMGGLQIGKSAYAAAKATTDKEAIEAWQGIGEGVSTTGLSVAGAKTIPGAKGLNPLKATVETFKEVPGSVKTSIKAFTSGEYKANLGIKGRFIPEEDLRFIPETTPPKVNITKTPEQLKAAHEKFEAKKTAQAETGSKNTI